MTQTASPLPVVNRRLAQFGVALIALIVVACFAVLIVARAEARPVATQAAPLVAN